MARAKRTVTPRDIARARRLYEHTNTPVEHITRMLGVSRTAFYKLRKKWGWKLRHDRIPRQEPPREPDEIEPAQGRAPQPSEIDRAALATGMYALVQTTMDAVARIMAQTGPRQTQAAEDAARMTASLARTLDEIARFEQRSGLRRKQDNNDRGPADPDEFARELLRRLEAFTARGAPSIPDEPAAGVP